MSTRISAQFIGGVADGINLTGSCYLFEVRKEKQIVRFAVDLGMWQGNYEKSYERNRELGFNPGSVDFMVVTHSHIDHIGRLPLAAKKGFSGRIFCTEPTAELLEVMLMDSAKVLESETRYRLRRMIASQAENAGLGEKLKTKNRNGIRNLNSMLKTGLLFSERDVGKCLGLVKNGGFPYGEWIKLEKDINVKFYPSGHVLGGAICVIEIGYRKKKTYIGFSGDLGRRDGIILPPPATIEEPLDYWFIESTYGGESHPKRHAEIKKLFGLIKESENKRGKIIIPSFVLERAQEIIYLISSAMTDGDVPKMPIFLDSPMAERITEVFGEHWKTPMFKDQGRLNFNPFNLSENPFLFKVESDFESVALSRKTGPHIIIAGSGMSEAGRVRNHLRAQLSNSNAVVCLVGHMVEGTLGWKLQQGYPLVSMNGNEIPVRAEIVSFKGFSAHASGNFLVEYTIRIGNNSPDMKVFIVHGEEKNGLALKKDLIEAFNEDWHDRIFIPEINQKVSLE
jgi:metallo-beta-lactamase family protein